MGEEWRRLKLRVRGHETKLLVVVAAFILGLGGLSYGIHLVTKGTEELILPPPSSSCTVNGVGESQTCWAVFAMGCFWCGEADFEKLPWQGATGDVFSGYMGGDTEAPNYQNHATSGHYEVVAVPYNPREVSYRVMLLWFWRNVDFLNGAGQFCDSGKSYRAAIFVDGGEQREQAEESRSLMQQELGSGLQLQVPVRSLESFWLAEDYHQNYYKEEAGCYAYYRAGCGRDSRLESLHARYDFTGLASWAEGAGGAMQNQVMAIMSATHQQDVVTGCAGNFLSSTDILILVFVLSSGAFIGSLCCCCSMYKRDTEVAAVSESMGLPGRCIMPNVNSQRLSR